MRAAVVRVLFALALADVGARAAVAESTASGAPVFEVETASSHAIKGVELWQSADELTRCQAEVVGLLESKCGGMGEEMLGKLAVNLYNCQAQAEGRPVFICDDGMALQECTAAMDSTTWGTYLLVSNRARATCFKFQQERWRMVTEQTINSLSEATSTNLEAVRSLRDGHQELEALAASTLSSIEAGQVEILAKQAGFETQLAGAATRLDAKLTQSLENNQRLMADQETALQNQHAIMEQSRDVEAAVNLTRGALRDVHDEISEKHATYMDAMESLFKGLESIANFESALLQQFFDIQSVVFYVCALSLGALLTSARRTARARLYVFVALTLNVVVERAIVVASTLDEAGVILQGRLWLARKLFVAVAATLLAYAALTYRDLAQLSLSTIHRVEQQQAQILQYLQRSNGGAAGAGAGGLLPAVDDDGDEAGDPDYEPDETLSSSDTDAGSWDGEGEGDDDGVDDLNLTLPLDGDSGGSGYTVGGYRLRARGAAAPECNPVVLFETAAQFGQAVRYHYAEALLRTREVVEDLALSLASPAPSRGPSPPASPRRRPAARPPRIQVDEEGDGEVAVAVAVAASTEEAATPVGAAPARATPRSTGQRRSRRAPTGAGEGTPSRRYSLRRSSLARSKLPEGL